MPGRAAAVPAPTPIRKAPMRPARCSGSSWPTPIRTPVAPSTSRRKRPAGWLAGREPRHLGALVGLGAHGLAGCWCRHLGPKPHGTGEDDEVQRAWYGGVMVVALLAGTGCSGNTGKGAAIGAAGGAGARRARGRQHSGQRRGRCGCGRCRWLHLRSGEGQELQQLTVGHQAAGRRLGVGRQRLVSSHSAIDRLSRFQPMPLRKAAR